MKDIIAVTSDWHCNSTLGLCPPELALDDGGMYHASHAQLWLWQHWLEFWSYVRAKAYPDGHVYAVHNGDLVDIIPQSVQLISYNETTAVKCALVATTPLQGVVQTHFVIRGTQLHTGASGYLEEIVAGVLGAEPCPATGTKSWWHLQLQLQGVLFDVAHHRSLGHLPWTEVNPMQRLIYEVIAQASANKRPLPQFIVRSHGHRRADTFDSHPMVRAIATPGWQLTTDYGHRIATNRIPHVGGVVFTITNGKTVVDTLLYTPQPDLPWLPTQLPKEQISGK